MDAVYGFLPRGIIDGHAVNITVQMAHNDILAGHLLQKAAHLLHQFIAHNDSQSVIYLTEIVNVNQQYAYDLPLFLGPAHIL